MSRYAEFRKLTGLQTYLPTLEDARAIPEDEYLEVGAIPSFVGEGSRVQEMAAMGELKLGITSVRRDPGAMAAYTNSRMDPKAPVNKKAKPPVSQPMLKSKKEDMDEALDPHHMNAHELAAYTGSKHMQHSDHGKDHNEYFHASGKAHHVGNQAHEFSAMMKSGELPKDKAHHEKAHDLHLQAYTNHKIAGGMAGRLGHSAQRNAHDHESGRHQDALARHGKKIGKEYS